MFLYALSHTYISFWQKKNVLFLRGRCQFCVCFLNEINNLFVKRNEAYVYDVEEQFAFQLTVYKCVFWLLYG